MTHIKMRDVKAMIDADINTRQDYIWKIQCALFSVLEIEEKKVTPTDSNYMGHYQAGHTEGYNQALADMAQAILKGYKKLDADSSGS